MADASEGTKGAVPPKVVLQISNIPSHPNKEQINSIVSAASETLRSILDPDRLETEGVKEWIAGLGVKFKAKVHTSVTTTADVEVSN